MKIFCVYGANIFLRPVSTKNKWIEMRTMLGSLSQSGLTSIRTEALAAADRDDDDKEVQWKFLVENYSGRRAMGKFAPRVGWLIARSGKIWNINRIPDV